MVLHLCFRSFKAMIPIKYLSERTVKAALSNCFLTSGAKKRNRRQNEGCWVVIVSRPAEPEQQIVRFLLYSFSLVRETMNSLFGRLYARLSPGAVLFTSSLGRAAGSGCRFTARRVVLAWHRRALHSNTLRKRSITLFRRHTASSSRGLSTTPSHVIWWQVMKMQYVSNRLTLCCVDNCTAGPPCYRL